MTDPRRPGVDAAHRRLVADYLAEGTSPADADYALSTATEFVAAIDRVLNDRLLKSG